MGLFINGTDISETKEVFFNGTSMDKVFFNGTEVWTEGLPAVTYTDTRRHCIDHYLYVILPSSNLNDCVAISL